MTLGLREPTLLDTALVAARLIAQDRAQWREFTGYDYNAERVAVECWGYRGPRWAICGEDGMALAVAGCAQMRHGVYQTWFLSVPELWRDIDAVTDLTRGEMLRMLDTYAHRIETICLESRKTTRGWYERVGLHYEATFPHYGAFGADAVQYSVLREQR